jgi:hypothetical protein
MQPDLALRHICAIQRVKTVGAHNATLQTYYLFVVQIFCEPAVLLKFGVQFARHELNRVVLFSLRVLCEVEVLVLNLVFHIRIGVVDLPVEAAC